MRLHAGCALPRPLDIGQGAGDFYARPRYTKPAMPRQKFRAILPVLLRKAIRGKISREDYGCVRWAAQPRSVWRTCRPFLLDLERDPWTGQNYSARFAAPSSTLLFPSPKQIAAGAEVTLELMKISTRKQRRRKPNAGGTKVIEVVHSHAYSARMTGKRGGQAILHGGPGRLHPAGPELSTDYSARKFFRKADSSRLRK